jgi:uncharacterized linocin/CFP29 family protein
MYPAAVSPAPSPSPEDRALAALWARVKNNSGNLNREKLPWAPELWEHIDQAVHDEIRRTVVGRRFIPLVPSADALTVPADKVIETGAAPGGAVQSTVLTVNEAAVTEVIEIWVEFALTKQQVEAEPSLSTAVTLATRAANLVAQGEDLLLFQGNDVIKSDPLFTAGKIQTRAGPGPFGLANTADPPGDDGPIQSILVPLAERNAGKYGENTFTAVAQAYSDLQSRGHYGPYALVLPTRAYADAHAPLKTTLIMPADRILPMVEGRFYGTGTLPECLKGGKEQFADVGVLASLGGNTVDLVFGRDATTAFVVEDNQGLYRFRVFERFALRDKDRSGRVALLFERQDCG